MTLKVLLKPEANEDGQHTVRLRVTKDRVPRYHSLSITLQTKHFNANATRESGNWVRKSHHDHGPLNDRILEQIKKVEKIIAGLEKQDDPFSAEEVITLLKTGGKPDLLIDYVAAHIARRKELAKGSLQRLRTTRQYEDMQRVLTDFLTEKKLTKLMVRQLTGGLVEEWKLWMLRKYASNTAAHKLSCFRKIVREALDDELITHAKYPFRKVKVVVKRKSVDRLREGDIEQLIDEPRRDRPAGKSFVTDPKHARGMALLMYYAQGIRLADLLQLRVADYRVSGDEHRLVYKTGKSSKERDVLLPPEAAAILAPYPLNDDGTRRKDKDFLFPYVSSAFDLMTDEEKVGEIARASGRLHSQIKRLGTDIGLTKKIAPHIMRHSFADLMRRNGVDLLTIQMSLGHSDPRTTRDYMDSLDQEAVDNIAQLFSRKTSGKQILKDAQSDSVQPPVKDELNNKPESE